MKMRLLPAAVALLLAACASGSTASRPPEAAAPTPAPTRAAALPAAPTAAPAAQPARPAQLEMLKMGLPSGTATFAPFFIAIEKGYLAEEGLQLEPNIVAANVSIASLLTGELQFSGSGASAVSAALKGAELKVIYTSADRPLSEVWTNTPDVRTLADLVGKPVGVQSRGDSTELALRIALTEKGIAPTELTYLAVGVGGQRLAAIQAGSVAAATLLTTEVVELQEAIPTARRVANLRDEAQMVYGGVSTHDRELREHRDRTRRFLRAAMKGREYYKAFREESIQILSKYNQSPRSANESSYDETLWTMDGDASVSLDVQRRDTAARAQLNDVDQVPPPEQIFDYSLVQDVYRELQASPWRPAR
jgi:NitT/TauT family transport system substrate-binding protein